MSGPGDSGSLRQRAPKKKASYNDINVASESAVDKTVAKAQDKVRVVKEQARSDWDYKLAVVVVTILAFATRFWGITHPNQVVFDEVHFGKVGMLFI